MPSFLSRHGSNRLRKPRKTGDEGATGRTGAGAGAGTGGGGWGGGGGGGGGGIGNAGRDPKSSLVLFTAVSNSSSSNSHSSASVNKLQRSESSKRRFGFNTILTRGKNRNDIGQGIVSSKIGDMRHQAAGSRAAAGEPGAGSKDGILPAASQQQQPSAPIVQLVRTPPPEKSPSPPNTTSNTNNSPTRAIAPVLSLPPAVSPVISSPAEFSSQPQDHSMAATATMTSVMQQPSRPSLSLALSVPQAPSFSSNIPQRSGFSSSFPLPPPHDKSAPMLNTIDTYSPLLSSPVVANATAISFSRPALVDGRLQIGHHGTLSDTTIGTPLGYYITPSQTPTLVDRPDTHFSPRPVPTVMRPGPSTPPLTESSVSLSLSVAKIALPTAPETHLQLANIPSIPISIPGDRLFNNGPPTPTSSDSSQKDRDPNRHVNFLQENGTPTSSIRSIGGGGGSAGNMYPNPPPQQYRFSNRPPPPGRPRGNHPRPNQPPLRGHPRRMPVRGPPRPPSPIYMPPPDMKNHIWMPFKSDQLECSMGHSLVPFRNKQHSIPCTVCRSIEFEGRGEPVKRSYYCAWCAVRMCGGCKEELGVCQGRLAELWDRTEEKRNKNMTMIKDGTRPKKQEKVAPEERNSNNESLEPGWAGPVDEQARGKTSQRIISSADVGGLPFPGQRTPPRGQPQRQLVIPQPQQSIPRPQQSIPQPQQSYTQQPQQLGAPQAQQSRVYQIPSDGERVPQQPRQSSRGPPLPEKPGGYLPTTRQTAPLNIFPTRLPQPVPQLTPEETQKYRLVSVPTVQKPPQSSTVVLVGEKQKESGTFPASLKGSVTKKRNWFRGFGKKKEV